MARSLTASNIQLTLAVVGVVPVPQAISEFAVDDIFDTDTVEPTEVEMGVDGRMSAGYVFVPIKQGINLQANSPSNDFFDAWKQAQDAVGDQFFAQGVIIYPAINKKWVMTGGALSSYPPIPNAGKILKPRKYGITWERVVPTPI
jgi:hypothetical protein